MKKQGMNTKLVSHILILSLVAIIAVSATFSWYDRNSSNAGSANLLTYSQSGNVNGKGGTIKTYAGKNNKGIVTYSDTDLSESQEPLTTKPGEVSYFKTVIDSSCYGTVSVYLENLSYQSSLGDKVHVGIIQPEKTYKSFSTTSGDGYYIASNICLEDNLMVSENENTVIYWFVEVGSDTTNSGNINLGTMHLVYN